MSWQILTAKYGGSGGRQTLNLAVRAEIPGGALLLDARAAMESESRRPRIDRPPAQVRAIRETVIALDRICDAFRKSILETYRCGASTHAPEEATPTLSIDALKKTSLGEARDNQDWTPSAVIVEQMGKISDSEISRLTGVSATKVARERERLDIAPAQSDKDAHFWTPAMDKMLGTKPDGELAAKWTRSAEAVRRRREKLGIPPCSANRKQSWTPERLQVLRDQPDNAKAAAALGVSVNAVKIQRSRLK